MKKKRAFTLVELLVAMAVLATLMVLLFSFFDQATRAWKTSEKKIDAFREARAAMYYLKRDLQSMQVSADIPWYLYDDPSGASGLVPVASSPSSSNGDVLFFISAQSSLAQKSGENKSSLCAAGYYLAWRPDPGPLNHSSFSLYRYFRSSDATWGNNLSDPANSSYGLFVFLKSGKPLFEPASNEEVIARNVINFKVSPYKSDFSALSVSGASHEKPAFIEISLTAYNHDTASKFTSRSDWEFNPDTTSSSWTQLQRENAQTFKIRVALP